MRLPDYSVLMSVYYKENPAFFRQAVESMLKQTVKPAQFVLVCDGPLKEETERVVEAFERDYPEVFETVRLKENMGLSCALNAGLKHCRCEIIARMDSDDLAYSDRMRLQLCAVTKKKLDICSAAVEEFSLSADDPDRVRAVPETHSEIIRFARRRNPFNHPCTVYRKSAVEAVDGYENYRWFEDYQLWIKMLSNGARAYNIQKPLLKMRAGRRMYERRGGTAYLKSAALLERYKLSVGFSDILDFSVCMLAKTVFALSPSVVRELLYRKLLRKD